MAFWDGSLLSSHLCCHSHVTYGHGLVSLSPQNVSAVVSHQEMTGSEMNIHPQRRSLDLPWGLFPKGGVERRPHQMPSGSASSSTHQSATGSGCTVGPVERKGGEQRQGTILHFGLSVKIISSFGLLFPV